MTLQGLHSDWAYIVIAANIAVGAWGLVRWRRGRAGNRPYWIGIAIAWATIYIQGMMGLAMFEEYQPPFRHHFYGFLFVIITLAVFPMRGENPRRTLLIFALATLFIGIVAIRATYSL